MTYPKVSLLKQSQLFDENNLEDKNGRILTKQIKINNLSVRSMALWHKLKRMAKTIQTKTKHALRRISEKRPIVLRSVFAKNFAVIATSLFVKRDRLKPAITKQTQMIAEMQIPRIFRQHIYKAYSKFYGVNLKEVELPLKDYPTFSSFFTRKITRPLPPALPSTVSSPCDGKVLVFEEITGDKCQIIKGHKYSVSELVTGVNHESDPSYIMNQLKIKKESKLYQMVIYLAPGDYHRFHAPTQMNIIKRYGIDGRCDSVSEKTISKGKPIYQKNGRMTVTAQWSQGLITMVMVGALNVMRIHLTEKDKLERGQQLGYFNLGSTIVMIVQIQDLKELMALPGTKTKVGQPLFSYI